MLNLSLPEDEVDRIFNDEDGDEDLDGSFDDEE